MIDPSAQIPRRAFIVDIGRGAVAVAVFGVAACAPAISNGGPSAEGGPSSGGSPSPGGSPPPSSDDSTSPPPSGPQSGGMTWERVRLGSVSAYLLVRHGEAALVDTGNPGSANDIEAALDTIGLGWDAVGHVILTHLHGDHIGSTADVMTRAAGATGYAGAPDIPAIDSPRPITAVADGDDVFGLRIVATPGHTAGHVSVFDPLGGILIAGDALNIRDGQVFGANPQFTADMAMANESVKTLATLTFGTLLVGHGDPIASDASAAVAALAATL
jgi:glyoxylase-like metal-dependent hydrolase (beta-lactamase superfamily II)